MGTVIEHLTAQAKAHRGVIANVRRMVYYITTMKKRPARGSDSTDLG